MSGALKGKDSVVRAMLAAAGKMRGAAAAALYQEGLALDAESVKRTPVDTGRLRATHYVSPPVDAGKSMYVEIGNGTDYAVYVHEMTELRHVTGEAQFLQNAMNARSAGMLDRLAKRTRANLRAGVTSAVLSGSVPTAPQVTGGQLGPTRHEFNIIQRKERRGRVAAKRRARRAERRERKALASAMANGRKRVEQRQAKAERKAARNAERKAKNSAARAAKKQRTKDKAYAARWKAAEKAHAKKSRTGWKGRRKFRKRRK